MSDIELGAVPSTPAPPDPDEGVPDPARDGWTGGPTSRKRRRRRIVVALLATFVVVIILAISGVAWAGSHLHGAGGAEVDVTIPPGTSTSGIADLLARRGVVSDGWLFRLYLRYEGARPFAAGKYAFHHGEGYTAAVAELRAGPKIVLAKLVIPEGFTLKQIGQRVGALPGRSAAAFEAAASAGTVRSRFEPAGSNTLEGLVFPDTYLVSPDETEAEILQQMVSEFDQLATTLAMDAPGALPNGLTAYQTVVLASMIEREAKVPEDRGMIARVIVNRLQRGMKLQIDATVLYAIGKQTTSITKSDLNVNSPYNTYRVTGLPPGPIASAGRASLLAALAPTPGTWLYYVLADASGKHAFATTDAQFRQLEAKARAEGLL